MVLRLFHSPASISLMQGLARGAAERPRECFCPSRLEVSRPGSITGAPLQSVPHRHRDTNTGPGSVAPHGWGRKLCTRGHVAGRHDNGSKAMINSNNPNTPPRGSTLLSFYAGKRKRKSKSGAARVFPAGRCEASCTIFVLPFPFSCVTKTIVWSPAGACLGYCC